MAEVKLSPRRALHDFASPGMFGNRNRPPGVRVCEFASAASVLILPKPGSLQHCSNRCAKKFGAEFPEAGRASQGNGVAIVWAAPREWIAVGTEGNAVGLTAGLAEMFGADAAVVDQSDSRILLSLEGERIRDFLAKGIALDLDSSVFPPLSAAHTHFHGIGVTLWRSGEEFLLLFPRSYAQSLWHLVEISAAEYGLEFSCAP